MYSSFRYYIFYSWNLYIIWLTHTMHPLNRKCHRRKLWRQVLNIQWLNQRNCSRMTSLRSVRQATATFCPAKDLLLVQGPFHFLRFILVQYTRIFFLYTGKGILCWPGRLREKRKGPKLLNNNTEDVRGDSGGRGGNAHESWQSPGAALSKAESTVKS